MSKGIVYFAKNNDGYKLSFTYKKCVADALDNLNLSQVLHNFEFECGVYINNPKSVKDNLKKDILKHSLDKKKELYHFKDKSLPYKLLYSYSANGIMLKNKYDTSFYNNSEDESNYESDSSLEEFEVDCIVMHKGDVNNLKKLKFLVKWKGYESDENTYEPIKNLINNIQFREYINKHSKELNKIKEMIDIL